MCILDSILTHSRPFTTAVSYLNHTNNLLASDMTMHQGYVRNDDIGGREVAS